MKKGREIKSLERHISHAYELVDIIIWKWHLIKGYLHTSAIQNKIPISFFIQRKNSHRIKKETR